MSRTRIVAANWKMNKTFLEALRLTNDILAGLDKSLKHTQVVIAPPFVFQHTVGSMIRDYATWCHLGAQNCHEQASGAFTGEVSVDMLQSVGTEYVIIGHSERREQAKESDELLAKKVTAVIEKGLKIIFCCGEPSHIRARNEQERYVKLQLERSLFHLSDEQMRQVVIAYEPIWAIGTGQTATPQEAQSVHAFIRGLLRQVYTTTLAAQMPILYGGSCNALNAKELFAQPDIDGGLIGGASLKAHEFMNIVQACENAAL